MAGDKKQVQDARGADHPVVGVDKRNPAREMRPYKGRLTARQEELLQFPFNPYRWILLVLGLSWPSKARAQSDKEGCQSWTNTIASRFMLLIVAATIPVSLIHAFNSLVYDGRYGDRVGVMVASISPLPLLFMYWAVPQFDSSGKNFDLEDLFKLVFELDPSFRTTISTRTTLWTIAVLLLGGSASGLVIALTTDASHFAPDDTSMPIMVAMLSICWTVTIFVALFGIMSFYVVCAFHKRAREILIIKLEAETRDGTEPNDLVNMLDDHIDLHERLRRTCAAWNWTLTVALLSESFAAFSFGLTFFLNPVQSNAPALVFGVCVFVLMLLPLLEAASVTSGEDKMIRQAKIWFANCSKVSNDPDAPNFFKAEFFLATISVYPSTYTIMGNTINYGVVTDLIIYSAVLGFTVIIVTLS